MSWKHSAQVSHARPGCKVRLPQKTFETSNGFDLEMIEGWATQGVLADPLVFQSSCSLCGHFTLVWRCTAFPHHMGPKTEQGTCRIELWKGNKSCSPFLPSAGSFHQLFLRMPGIYVIFLFPASLFIVEGKIFQQVGICKTFQGIIYGHFNIDIFANVSFWKYIKSVLIKMKQRTRYSFRY